MNTQEHYRQGDVLIERVSDLPATRTKLNREQGRVILAHGEVTGHAHAIADEHVDLFDTADEAGVTYLEVRDAVAALEHDEHATIALEPGNYRVTRQREYVAPEIERPVAD
jgi:hypothetical protein